MKINAKILRSILAIALIVCTLLSLSSCMTFYDIMFDYIEENENNHDNNDENDGNDGDNNWFNPDNQEPATPPQTNIGEFYPGSGESNTENVPALKKTLLSTVIVIADHTYSPSAGSGVIYSINKENGDAYIITNYHVIFHETYGVAKNIHLYLFGMTLNGYEIQAEFVGGSVNYDIAVLKVSGSEVLKNSYAEAAKIGNSEKVGAFDQVYTVGNPEGYGISVSSGIVSVASENLTMDGADGSEVSLRVIRVDASVNSGNSGGGLYNSAGQLIGIVCAKRVGEDIDNIGYAIPSDLVINLAKNIIDHCDGESMTKVNRVLFGITITAYVCGLEIDQSTGNITEVELVEITTVSNTGIASEKLLVGDIIKSVTIDGNKTIVTRTYQVPEQMLNARVGSKVTFTIERDGVEMSFDFVIPESAITYEK